MTLQEAAGDDNSNKSVKLKGAINAKSKFILHLTNAVQFIFAFLFSR